jgi:hypothetical protein
MEPAAAGHGPYAPPPRRDPGRRLPEQARAAGPLGGAPARTRTAGVPDRPVGAAAHSPKPGSPPPAEGAGPQGPERRGTRDPDRSAQEFGQALCTLVPAGDLLSQEDPLISAAAAGASRRLGTGGVDPGAGGLHPAAERPRP